MTKTPGFAAEKEQPTNQAENNSTRSIPAGVNLDALLQLCEAYGGSSVIYNMVNQLIHTFTLEAEFELASSYPQEHLHLLHQLANIFNKQSNEMDR